MSEVVVFLVKNGIGFGHIRRALLVAAGVAEAGRLQPVLISQAGSLAVHRLRHRKVGVVNFPLLHRVPSAVTEDCYIELLDALLRRLDPAVVVEDTYPDPRYGGLPALRDVPRLLVLRRLDGLSFDQIRTGGGFARYEQILVAQDAAGFTREGHSGDSLTAARHSGRFAFVGDIATVPNRLAIDAVRRRYAPDGQQLVVVAAGAGGDQMPDGYADRLFAAAREVAARLEDDRPAVRFVLVTGPYYAGHPIPEGKNVDVQRFEPNLAALLSAADVAIIKPGNNSLTEALQGSAHLILVPDVSFMEGVEAHAARVVADYGGTVTPADPEKLYRLVRDALDRPPRRKRLVLNPTGVEQAVEAIHDVASQARHLAAVEPKKLILVVRPPATTSAERLRVLLPEPFRTVVTMVDNTSEPSKPYVQPLSALTSHPPTDPRLADGVLADVEPPTEVSPTDIGGQGCTLLLTSSAEHQSALTRWLRMNPPAPSILIADAARIRAHPSSLHPFTRRIAALLNRGTWCAVLLDLAAIEHEASLRSYLQQLTRWLESQPIHLATLDHARQSLARSLLDPS